MKFPYKDVAVRRGIDIVDNIRHESNNSQVLNRFVLSSVGALDERPFMQALVNSPDGAAAAAINLASGGMDWAIPAVWQYALRDRQAYSIASYELGFSGADIVNLNPGLDFKPEMIATSRGNVRSLSVSTPENHEARRAVAQKLEGNAVLFDQEKVRGIIATNKYTFSDVAHMTGIGIGEHPLVVMNIGGFAYKSIEEVAVMLGDIAHAGPDVTAVFTMRQGAPSFRGKAAGHKSYIERDYVLDAMSAVGFKSADVIPPSSWLAQAARELDISIARLDRNPDLENIIIAKTKAH
ncbi:MAG: hypothetical protein LBL52_04585 [Rickettsiales bacterium]|jgi:hypothetical protein|nr:hypothetical protein [Rickettsiales bacterium]